MIPVLPGSAPHFNVQGSTFNIPRWPNFFLLFLLFVVLLSNLKAQDTIILKNGRKAECRVIDFTDTAVKISYRATPTAAPADRLIPLTEVDYVELAPLPGETEALTQAVREGRSEPLMSFWVKRIPWLNRPRTNGGEIGLTYAELLTRTPSSDRMERALKIYEQIEAADWSAERRGRAQAGRLRVMLRQGRTAEVRPMAEALLQQSGDARVLIELRHVMAEASAAALTQLEKDHPRWQEEDELVPRHTQLLNEALDGYLYPHLFHGAEEDLAARGLWAAAQLSAAQKLTMQASDWSTDLTKLYASQPEAKAAQAWIDKQPAPAVAAALKPPAKTRTKTKAAAEDPDETEEEMEEDSVEPEAEEEEPKAKPKKKTTPKAKPKSKPKAKPKAEPESEMEEEADDE